MRIYKVEQREQVTIPNGFALNGNFNILISSMHQSTHTRITTLPNKVHYQEQHPPTHSPKTVVKTPLH